MKDFRIIDLKDFLSVTDSIDTPFKFLELQDDMLKATVWMRTALITYEGKKDKIGEDMLKEHGFKPAIELETRKIILEEMM